MLLVPTYIAKSSIAGIGLFAGRDIQKGEVVWRFVEGFDRRVSAEDLERLPEAERKEVLFWGYFNRRTGFWIMCGDEARRVNHSSAPNLAGGYGSDDPTDEGFEVAARDIKQGEELTDNYFDYDIAAQEKLSGHLATPDG